MIQSNSGEHGNSSFPDLTELWTDDPAATAGWSWFVDIRGRVREEKNQQQSQDRAVRVQKSRVGKKTDGRLWHMCNLYYIMSSNKNWMWFVL